MSQIKKNTMYVAVGQVLRLGMAFLLLPVVSRVLGDESFGRYSLATTVMFFVMLVDDIGLNMWLTREIAKRHDRALRYLAFATGLKVLLISAAVVFVLVLLKINTYDHTTMITIWIFAFYAILISFRDMVVSIFRAFEEMKWEALVLSLERILITVLGILALLSGGRLVALSWMFVVSAMISLAVSAVILKRFVKWDIAFSIKEFVPMIKGASVFGLSLFLTTIYTRVDMVMLSMFKPPQVWGWYGAAHRLLDFSNFIPMVLMTATFPVFARYSTQAPERVAHLFTQGVKFLSILAIPIVPVIYFWSSDIIGVIYGREFLPASPALQILGLTAAVLFINIFAAGLFGATGHQHKLLAIQVVGLTLNVLLNFALIPSLAHIGAASATVITEILVLIITMAYVLQRITGFTRKRFLLDLAVATAVMMALFYFLSSWPLWLSTFSALTGYVLILAAFKTVTRQEVLNIKSLRAS